MKLAEKVLKLHEAKPDGYIAIYNGKKVEIPISIGSLLDAKTEAIKLLKVPKSKQGLLAIKPAYNESAKTMDIKVSGEDDSITTVKGASVSVNSKKWKLAKKGKQYYASKDGKIYFEIENDHPAIEEAQHYNTRMRQVESNNGSRHIRLGMKELYKMTNNMLDPNHDSPNPKGPSDERSLKECMTLMEQSMVRLKSVKETKRKSGVNP